MYRDNEIELLNKRFDFTRREIQDSINYYYTLHMVEIPKWLINNNPDWIHRLEQIKRKEGDYLGIYLEIDFIWEGDRQIWMGATYVGDSKWARREHFLGYIEISPVYVGKKTPVDVKIICGWPPLYYFFMGLSNFLDRKFTNEIYRLGIEKEGYVLLYILNTIEQLQLGTERNEEFLKQIIRDYGNFRLWAKSIQKHGIPADKQTIEAISYLAKDHSPTLGISQNLELSLPIVPGLINTKTALGVEYKLSLKSIWEKFKGIFHNKK